VSAPELRKGDLEGAVLALVARDEQACEQRAAALRGAGATVHCALVQVNGLATLSAASFDAALIDVGEEPETFVAFARALREDGRTESLPVVALLSPDVTIERCAPLGLVYVVCDGSGDALLAALCRVVRERRNEVRAAAFGRTQEERLRAAIERLTVMRKEAQSVTHDAKALCAIVVGFAANLRDGIAGPLDVMQREHVARILEAAHDTSALVDRFGTVVRVQTELPSETSASAPPRAHRRTRVDLVELCRTTIQLLSGQTAVKALDMTLDASAPVPVWCDAMQIKQVVTNLLVNAIKFTPRGGRVTVAVRVVAPASATPGPGARQSAEIAVLDSGPGVPEADRQRIFERGVRLARDKDVPGTGIGLSVVREMVTANAGSISVQEAPAGGAAFVVRLPTDMRTRRDASILLVDDPGAARRIAIELQSRRDRTSVRPLDGDGACLSSALEQCNAVVVVPRGPHAGLEELFGPRPETPSSGKDHP